MRIRSVRSMSVCSVVCALAGSALGQTFDVIPGPAGLHATAIGVSADGSVVGGWTNGPTGSGAFYWTRAGGRQDLGAPQGFGTGSPTALSGDGTTLVGLPGFRYRGPGTYQSLGSFGPYPNAWANGVNGDGNVIVGEAFNSSGTSGEAWRWTPGSGMQGLGRTRPGHTYSVARGVSRDGQTIVGSSGGGGASGEAFRWTATGGLQALSDQPGTIFSATAAAANHDGSIIVGNSGLPGNPPAIWRGDDLPTILPIPTGWANAGGNVISDDGTVVAGQARNPSFEQEAWIWTQGRGSESLLSYLTFHGVSVPAGWRLGGVTGVSADGRTIVGGMANLTGGLGAGFVATVPTPGVCVTVCAALLATSRRKR